jgi:hypothetical protein
MKKELVEIPLLKFIEANHLGSISVIAAIITLKTKKNKFLISFFSLKNSFANPSTMKKEFSQLSITCKKQIVAKKRFPFFKMNNNFFFFFSPSFHSSVRSILNRSKSEYREEM